MFGRRQTAFVVITFILVGWHASYAHDLKITIPGRSELTPVQRLNRQGVTAIARHQYETAQTLFYKAYLYDPSDPFTLNNLGYICELVGDLDRALKFYALAAEQGSNASIDLSNVPRLKGRPMADALNNLKDTPMLVNRMNVEAIELLAQGQGFAADTLLLHALALQPANPFTLLNLGVADEATGNFAGALHHYDAAAEDGSSEPIVVTLDTSARGKPVSPTAAESARRLRKRIRNLSSAELRATMLTFRGVSEVNRSDWAHAKQDFLDAYSLNPDSAFSLNNRGYVAEKEGDLETAQFFYAKARKAQDANDLVGLATSSAAQGQSLLAVARNSGLKVSGKLDAYSQAQRQQTGPIELIPRGDAVSHPSSPATRPDSTPAPPQSPE